MFSCMRRRTIPGAYDGGYRHSSSEQTLSVNVHEPDDHQFKENILQPGTASSSSFSLTSSLSLGESDKIRLLKLDVKRDGPLTGTLVTCSLNDLPVFYALSYCWGIRKKSEQIVIDGHSMKITPSLAEALNQISNPKDPSNSLSVEYLWVDQICINQGDHGERRHQVTLMGSIYRASQRTLIWLGEDNDNIAETAFGTLKKIEALWLEECPLDGEQRGIAPRLYDAQFAKDKGVPDYYHPASKALFMLMAKPWFGRLWVIQEAVLSRADPIVICGMHDITWPTLARAANWLCEKGFVSAMHAAQQFRNVEYIYTLRRTKAQGVIVDLGWLATAARQSFQSTDARDKVYGLMGLAEENDLRNKQLETKLCVSYDDDYSPSLLYRDLARHTIISTGSLAVLAGTRCPSSHVRDPSRSVGRQASFAPAPSWTPSFDKQVGSGGHSTRSIRYYDNSGTVHQKLEWRDSCAAAAYKQASMEHPPANINVLRLKGIQVTEVVQVLELNTNSGQTMQFCGPDRWIKEHGGLSRDWSSFRGMSERYGISFASRVVASAWVSGFRTPSIWRLFEAMAKHDSHRDVVEIARAVLTVATGGTAWTGETIATNEIDVKEFCLLLLKLQRDFRLVDTKSEKVMAALERLAEFTEGVEYDDQKYASRLFPLMQEWQDGRRYYLTAAGLVGLGPPGMKRGDQICVLYGGGCPFVLRRKKDFWVMIGEAFNEGLMDGEAIKASEAEEVYEEWFDIH